MSEVASNPLVWKQHLNHNRYQKEIFRTYFQGAVQSKSAFLILNSQNNNVVGCSRFYDLNLENISIKIGYTFIGIDFWGREFNKNIKKLMIEHVFKNLDKVNFDVGAKNIRSQNAMAKIGAI